VYERETWVSWSAAQILEDEVTDIGRALCMDGDRFAAGSDGSYENNNRLVVYTWDGISWAREQELTLESGGEFLDSTFPFKCALSGNLLLGYREGDMTLWTWEYVDDAWVQDEQPVPFGEGIPSDDQGIQFSYTNGYLVVTLPYENSGLGCIIIYQRITGGWTATHYFCSAGDFIGEHAIVSEYEGADTTIGTGLACRDGVCVVTSKEDTDTDSDRVTVRVLVLEESTWTIQKTVHALLGTHQVLLTSDYFITSVSWFNDSIGQVFVYDATTFQSVQNITTEVPNTFFGTKIQSYEDQLVVAPDPFEGNHLYFYTQFDNAYTKAPTTVYPTLSPTITTETPTQSPLLFVAYNQLGSKLEGMGTVYGYSVAMTNEYAFAGMNGENFEIDVYERTGDTFSVVQQINVLGAEANYKTLCVQDTHLLIAVSEYDDTGAVFYYTLVGSTWELTGDPLVGSSLLPFSQFGYSMDLSNSTLAIGAPYYDNNRGKVYIFKRTGGTWTEDAVIVRDIPEAGDNLGRTVKLSSDETTLAIGCHDPDSPDPTTSRIWVYAYEVDTWVIKSELFGYNHMGYALGFVDSLLVATATDANRQTYFQSPGGKLITYEKQGEEYVELFAQDVDGETFVIHDGMLFLGDAMGIETSGSVIVYERQETGWLQSISIQGTDGFDSDKQGYALAVYGDYLVVGAPLASSGAVWFFKRAYTP
jgi:hypothetical protein